MSRLLIYSAIIALVCSGASAQTDLRSNFQAHLNSSSICDRIGLSQEISILGIRTNIGIDRNHHSIRRFERSRDEIIIEGELACQPSNEGLLSKAGLSMAALRVSSNFGCQARVSEGRAADVNCSASGIIADALTRNIGLNDIIKNALNVMLPRE